MFPFASDPEHLKLGTEQQYHELQEPSLPKNNKGQGQAIITALTKSLSLIQGPPGLNMLSFSTVFLWICLLMKGKVGYGM
jgi:hypothetical protein